MNGFDDTRRAQHQLMRDAEATELAALTAQPLDVEVHQLRESVRALTDRVAQLEARLAAADPGVDHPRRPRGRG